MLTVIYIDRITGFAIPGILSALSSLSGFALYCEQFGWDIVILGYEPRGVDISV